MGDQVILLWQSQEILNVFNTLKEIFGKMKTFLKNWITIFSWKYYFWKRNISIQNCSGKY